MVKAMKPRTTQKNFLFEKESYAIHGEHRAQLHNYLKVTGLKLGLLVNFGP